MRKIVFLFAHGHQVEMMGDTGMHVYFLFFYFYVFFEHVSQSGSVGIIGCCSTYSTYRACISDMHLT